VFLFPLKEVVMVGLMRRLVNEKKGAALVEYALIVAGVALIGAATISVFGHKTNDMLATATAVLPGAHVEDNAPIVSGRVIETSPNAPGLDQGNSATGIGLDVNAITQANGSSRLANDVGSDGTLTSLVLESSPSSGSK
jgi:pilus assembly protein Flp/PilA